MELDKVKTRAESSLHVTNDLSQISLGKSLVMTLFFKLFLTTILLLTTVNVCLAVRNLILAAIRNPKKTVSTLLPYIPVALAFGAFLLWNGNIVLGDRTMHVAVLHVPQIYYFASFTVAMLVPYLLDTTIIRSTFSTLASNLRCVLRRVMSVKDPI